MSDDELTLTELFAQVLGGSVLMGGIAWIVWTIAPEHFSSVALVACAAVLVVNLVRPFSD